MIISIDLGQLTKLDFTENDERLLALLVEAHKRAASSNPSASNQAFLAATAGSLTFRNGVVAALMTIGSRHAPIREARAIYEQATPDWIANEVKAGRKVFGFGNSFFKDKIDPAVQNLYQFLSDEYPEAFTRIAELTKAVRSTGKKLYPNIALFTGCVCSIIDFARGREELIFLLARAPIWAQVASLPIAPKK